MPVCRYYRGPGTCTSGDDCRYRHVDPVRNVTIATRVTPSEAESAAKAPPPLETAALRRNRSSDIAGSTGRAKDLRSTLSRGTAAAAPAVASGVDLRESIPWGATAVNGGAQRGVAAGSHSSTSLPIPTKLRQRPKSTSAMEPPVASRRIGAGGEGAAATRPGMTTKRKADAPAPAPSTSGRSTRKRRAVESATHGREHYGGGIPQHSLQRVDPVGTILTGGASNQSLPKLSCALCGIDYISSAKIQISHESGRRHKAALIDPPQFEHVDRWTCGPCNATFVSLTSYVQHLTQRDHARALQRLLDGHNDAARSMQTTGLRIGASQPLRQVRLDHMPREDSHKDRRSDAYCDDAPEDQDGGNEDNFRERDVGPSEADDVVIEGVYDDDIGTDADHDELDVNLHSDHACGTEDDQDEAGPALENDFEAASDDPRVRLAPVASVAEILDVHGKTVGVNRAPKAPRASDTTASTQVLPEPPNTTMMGTAEKIEALRQFEADAEMFLQQIAQRDEATATATHAKHNDSVRVEEQRHAECTRGLKAKLESAVAKEDASHSQALQELKEAYQKRLRALSDEHDRAVQESSTRAQKAIAAAATRRDSNLRASVAVNQTAIGNLKKTVANCAKVRAEAEQLLVLLEAKSSAQNAEASASSAAARAEDLSWAAVPPPPAGSWIGQRAAGPAEVPKPLSTTSPGKTGTPLYIIVETFPEKWSAQELFNIFCLYCNPVKITIARRQFAAIELSHPHDARLCVDLLDGCLRVGRRRLTCKVSYQPWGHADEDDLESRLWRYPHTLHRFKPKSGTPKRITPGRVLLCSSGDARPGDLRQHIVKQGAPEPIEVAVRAQDKMFVVFESISDAAWALALCNNTYTRQSKTRLVMSFNEAYRDVLGARRSSPRRQSSKVDELPAGWERVWDPARRRPYYANRKTRQSQWEHPSRHNPLPLSPERQRPSQSPRRNGESETGETRIASDRRSDQSSPSKDRNNPSPHQHRIASPPALSDEDCKPSPPKMANSDSVETEKEWARGAWSDDNEALGEEDCTSQFKRPHEHNCPVSLDVMTDPVLIQTCGCTTERKVAEEWFQTQQKSACPACGEPSEGNFTANKALRIMIQDWTEQYGDLEA